jgi:hypothetical protein
LRHFITQTTMGEAEAARGQHDDCVMAAAIGFYVAWRMAGGEIEPIAERRRRKAALDQLNRDAGQPVPDYRNSPSTAAEADERETDPDAIEDPYAFSPEDSDHGLYFDERTRA